MQDFIKADVFFFISTIAVSVISILIIIGLIYSILILKTTKKFIEKVKIEGEELIHDVRDMRTKLKIKQGSLRKAGAIFAFIRKMTDIGRKSE